MYRDMVLQLSLCSSLGLIGRPQTHVLVCQLLLQDSCVSNVYLLLQVLQSKALTISGSIIMGTIHQGVQAYALAQRCDQKGGASVKHVHIVCKL